MQANARVSCACGETERVEAGFRATKGDETNLNSGAKRAAGRHWLSFGRIDFKASRALC